MQWWSVTSEPLQNMSMSSATDWNMNTVGDSWTSGRCGEEEEGEGL